MGKNTLMIVGDNIENVGIDGNYQPQFWDILGILKVWIRIKHPNFYLQTL